MIRAPIEYKVDDPMRKTALLKLGEIRPLIENDLEMLLSWRNAPQVRSRMYTQHKISLEEHRKWWHVKSNSDFDRLFLYLYLNTPTGFISFSNIHKGWGTASWAFYASPEAPRGTGSRMEIMALDLFFEEMSMRKLCCEVLSSNPGVIALHLKHGFIQEGVRRRQVRTADGFDDIHELAIFAENWVERRPHIIEHLKGH